MDLHAEIASDSGAALELLDEVERWSNSAAREAVSASWPQPHRLQEVALRARDIVIAGAVLMAILPLLAAIAIAIKLDSRGPCLFIQRRGGRDGRAFPCVKFRTLTVLEDGAAVREVAANDDRITRVGRFLRRTALDELPQLINVLRGDMALVGPRPHALAHDERFTALVLSYPERFRVKPGLTGLAQVLDLRGAIAERADLERRVAADLAYVRHRSLWFDLRIILSTPAYILARRTPRFAVDDLPPTALLRAAATSRSKGGTA